MTVDQYFQRIGSIIRDPRLLEIDESADFQCDQTGGVPTSLCVCWEIGLVWLAPNLNMIDDSVDLTRVYQECADFGFTQCNSIEDYNDILKSLGGDAYENAYIPDDEDMEQTMS